MDKVLKKMIISDELKEIFESTEVIIPESREEIFQLAMGGNQDYSEVFYNVPNIGKVVECTVAKCKNGLAVNYTDPYMRRRDPNCMLIADDLPTDKERFADRFGKDFTDMRSDTIEWFKSLDKIIALPFMSGGKKYGYESILLVPANAGFFAGALADIQCFIPKSEIKDGFEPRGIMYVAPPFRHTHCGGKQVVVHNRSQRHHEIFSYNLYPGPSAKKGVYSILLDFGEKEDWCTLHASAVKITTPYENKYTIMHEGASGGGKSEMLENIHREKDGSILLAEGVITGEKIFVDLNENPKLDAVTDDMALAPPILQQSEKLTVTDAESGWFLRVDHIKKYGSELDLERITIHPDGPMIFLNIDAHPNSTALIWEHTMDAPGKPCPNPRIVLPKQYFGGKENDIAEVDLRSFGLRTPPTTMDDPSYGVIGIFHVLPPALAWIWRLVAPRGYANPSISDSGGAALQSEGVGSYWPFATGRKVDQANILLRQIVATPETRYVLIPNQHVGSYKVGFKAEWIAREYLSRRGSAPFKNSELCDLGVSVLGYAMKKLKLDGKEVPERLLKVKEQKFVGENAFNKGSEMLTEFFKTELKEFLVDDLDPLGKDIIETFINDGSLKDLNDLIPARYIVG